MHIKKTKVIFTLMLTALLLLANDTFAAKTRVYDDSVLGDCVITEAYFENGIAKAEVMISYTINNTTYFVTGYAEAKDENEVKVAAMPICQKMVNDIIYVDQTEINKGPTRTPINVLQKTVLPKPIQQIELRQAVVLPSTSPLTFLILLVSLFWGL